MHATLAKRTIPLAISLTMTAGCLFGAAGRLNWTNGWVLIGLSLLAGVAATAVLWRDPELAAERRNVKAGKGWDKFIVGFVVFLGPMAMWITAGLDVRFHGSNQLPATVVAGGVGVAVAGGVLIVRAMRANRFFSAVVRIQKDRGQTVVTGGPYRFVRHPAYAGMVAFTLATPAILAARWAFVPAGITVAVTVLRTELEDRTLQNELEGYTEYTRAVKYKLVPFIW